MVRENWIKTIQVRIVCKQVTGGPLQSMDHNVSQSLLPSLVGQQKTSK